MEMLLFKLAVVAFSAEYSQSYHVHLTKKSWSKDKQASTVSLQFRGRPYMVMAAWPCDSMKLLR